MNLLLLSNSTNFGEAYLGYSKEMIRRFLGDIKENIAFIPYAGVTFSWDEYEQKVNDALSDTGVKVQGIHRAYDPIRSIQNAAAIMVGGGNTFQLLNKLYENKLIEVIREKVTTGTPYIGWSAGANMACPSVKTTNDMPIVEPPSFKALALIPFQINPHYTEEVIPNHGGESRKLRIQEFLEVNRETKVIGLPEGMIIQVSGKRYELIGQKPVIVFQYNEEPQPVRNSGELNRILS